MDRDSLRGRAIVEESREAVVILDEEGRVLAASRRARQSLEGVREGEQMPEDVLRGDRGQTPLVIPYAVAGQRPEAAPDMHDRDLAGRHMRARERVTRTAGEPDDGESVEPECPGDGVDVLRDADEGVIFARLRPQVSRTVHRDEAHAVRICRLVEPSRLARGRRSSVQIDRGGSGRVAELDVIDSAAILEPQLPSRHL